MSEDNKNFGKGEGEDAIDKINKGKGDLKSDASEAFEEGKASDESIKDKAGESTDEAKEKAKDIGKKAEKKFDEAKKAAHEFGEETKEKTKEFTEDTKKAANEFADDAKKTANEFTEGAKEAFSSVGGDNKKMLAGILAIILGSLGIHKFILGYQKEGIIMLVVTVVLGFFTCGIGASAMGLVGLIEGIIYLTKSDEEFIATYQVGRKPWF